MLVLVKCDLEIVGFATVGRCLLQASIITRLFAFLVTNRLVLWFCAGVCQGQLKLIQEEDNMYKLVLTFG